MQENEASNTRDLSSFSSTCFSHFQPSVTKYEGGFTSCRDKCLGRSESTLDRTNFPLAKAVDWNRGTTKHRDVYDLGVQISMHDLP